MYEKISWSTLVIIRDIEMRSFHFSPISEQGLIPIPTKGVGKIGILVCFSWESSSCFFGDKLLTESANPHAFWR